MRVSCPPRQLESLFLLAAFVLGGCGPLVEGQGNSSSDFFVGEEARSRIAKHGGVDLGVLASATNLYFREGGTFNGTIIYWAFDCKNREQCFWAVGVPGESLKPWVPSRYAVVMEGPGFYAKELQTDLWDVRGIKNGLVSEIVIRGHERMEYRAIDLDRNRVYFHFESGGFPDTVYRPPAKPLAPGRKP